MSRWTALAALAGLALACATPLPDKAPTTVSPLTLGAREWRVVDQVVVVTDASGTMYRNETFPEAKALTRSFVSAMPAGNARSRSGHPYEAALIGFGGQDRAGVPLAPFDRSALSAAAARLQVMGDIDGYGGETPYRHVLAGIQDSLAGKEGRAAIVLFSDGLPDDPTQALAAARALSESRAGQICLHAVQTGNDPEGGQNLQELVSQFSCGTVRNASSLRSAAAISDFAHAVFAEQAPAPPPPPPPAPMADACQGTIRLRGITFGFDKATISSDSAVVLDVAVDQLKQCPNIRMRIDGHTDSTGPEEYNLGLSRRRAEAVKDYFVGHGISAMRLTTRGLGESQPIESNATREGRAANRRVELHPIQ